MVVGPTGIGKSAFAVEKARALGGVIVSADAFQVYRGLDIGTGKVSLAIREEIPHYLMDILEPHEGFSVVAFLDGVSDVIKVCRREDRPVILCGGTGFYLFAFLQGYRFDVPEPERYAVQVPRMDVAVVGLYAAREVVIRRINERVDAMIASGWVSEVAGLLARGILASVPGMQAIGYPEVVRFLGGDLSHEEMVDLIKVKTRQFAKRQMTWFRRFEHAEWIEVF